MGYENVKRTMGDDMNNMTVYFWIGTSEYGEWGDADRVGDITDLDVIRANMLARGCVAHIMDRSKGAPIFAPSEEEIASVPSPVLFR